MKSNEQIFTEALVNDFGNSKFLRMISDGTEIDYNEASTRSFYDTAAAGTELHSVRTAF